MKVLILSSILCIGLLFSACSMSEKTSTFSDENDSVESDANLFFDEFGVGFGGASSFKFHDGIYINSSDLILNTLSSNEQYKNITDYNSSKFEELSSYLSKSKYLVLWLTANWQESWFNVEELKRVSQSGRILVFNYWYFGDELMNGLPDDLSEYYSDVRRLKTFLDKIDAKKLLILEPEFNKENILDNPDNFITAMSGAIDILEDESLYISLCMTDTGSRGATEYYDKCGYENCALGDKYEWGRVKVIYEALDDKLDFISFQEMVGQFSRDPQNPGTWEEPNPKAYSDSEIGIEFLHIRIDNFATYLKESYNKPVFLPYITIPTATWSDNNANGVIDTNEVNESGWEAEASYVYKNLESDSLFGYAVMELFDNPLHDKGGYQYFMQNEYHLGVVKSDVVENQLSGKIEFKSDILNSIFKEQ